MESNLYTLHVKTCNNKHNIIIIKKKAKAICWELYKPRLELKYKHIIMESTAVLKAEQGGWMQQGHGYIMSRR